MSTPEIPDGMSPDARETWPSHDLIESWLGDSMYDFQLRPGEDVEIDTDDEAAMTAARLFRDVLGRFASGVTVVTAISGGEPVGMTCQSFSSVSLNPPLVLFIPAKTSRAWPMIQRSGRFCVNFLADDQAELSNQMASRGSDKFAGVPWAPAPVTGSPLLDGVLGYVDCQIHTAYEAGDHFVVIGQVVDLAVPDAEVTKPLLFFQGKYATTTT
ncbi:flavin reductase family protein [Nocardioides sp.]|uniref:flavin reductase family protein n=1 Tax=Nocardioides sp. TaxID=35761 RepID=UPI0035631F28